MVAGSKAHAGPRKAGGARVIVLLAGLAVAGLVVPAVAIALRRPHILWTGDRALTELAVRQAAGGHQLLGLGGRFGWRHPGPLWIALLVPLYELTAHASWSLAVSALAIHIAMVLVAVAAAARAGGARAAAVVAALATVYLQATGLVYWTNLWAGYAFAWPMLALIVTAALAATDVRAGWALPAAALVGTLEVQTDVSTVVGVAAIGLVAAGLRLGHYGWRRFLGSPVDPSRRLTGAGTGVPADAPSRAGHRPGEPSGPIVIAVAIWAVVVTAWVPPVIEQLTSHPGNLTLLARFGANLSGGYPVRTALAAVGAALSVVPLGARWVLRDGFGARLGPGPWWAVGVSLAYVGATGAAGVVAWRRGRRMAANLAILSLTATVAAVVSITRVQGPINFYLLTWMAVVPVAALASVVLAAAPAAVTRADPVVVAGAALVAVTALVVVITGGTTHDWDRRSSAMAGAQTALLEQALGPVTGRARIHVATPDTWPAAAGVALQLARRGAKVEVDAPWVFLFGDGARPRPGVASTEVWFSRAHERPDVTNSTGVVELGTVGQVDVFARHNPTP